MNLPIITADQRLAERRGVKGVLVGKSGIGKWLPGVRVPHAERMELPGEGPFRSA